MNPSIISEYQELISSQHTQVSTDREAEENLAKLSQSLRDDVAKISAHLVTNPSDHATLGYLGVMFYKAIQTTNRKIVEQLTVDGSDAVTAISELRSSKSLQVLPVATAAATWLNANQPLFFWIAIQLVLLHPIQKTWGAAASNRSSEDTSYDSTDNANDDNE